MAQKKNVRGGKKSTRRNAHQKKARSAKVMALSARDAVKKQPLKSNAAKARENPVPGTDQTQTVNPIKAAKPINKQADLSSSAPVVVAARDAKSMFASQMDAFATLLKWSPLGMVLRQQALVADMIFNMRYPKKSELI